MSMAASPPVSDPRAYVVMGVSGCGKTTVAIGLAAWLGLDFIEGDSLHPPENISKMSLGVPLTDDDRIPWLDRIGTEVAAALDGGKSVVVTCSSLKRIYRERLRGHAGGRMIFVFLTGDRDLLVARMGARLGHFMPVSLLDSQLATLEDPSGEPGVVTVDIDGDTTAVIDRALAGLRALGLMTDQPATKDESSEP